MVAALVDLANASLAVDDAVHAGLWPGLLVLRDKLFAARLLIHEDSSGVPGPGLALRFPCRAHGPLRRSILEPGHGNRPCRLLDPHYRTGDGVEDADQPGVSVTDHSHPVSLRMASSWRPGSTP